MNTSHTQDLHIHTIHSTGDGAVVQEQTPEIVAAVAHADVLGISDHLDYLVDGAFESYEEVVRSLGLHVGCEVGGAEWTEAARELPFDYYVYHCRDRDADYRGAASLLSLGRPVIIAHPLFLGTNLDRVPSGCVIEINNRYVWRSDWRGFEGYKDRFQFVYSSDAHQPHWLNQNVARYVGRRLGIHETLLLPPKVRLEPARSE